MKKLSLLIGMAFALIVISFCSGCVPISVKKEAEANRIRYEDAFRRKVEAELGRDYILTDVQGRIMDFGGSSMFGSRYMADYALEGKVQHNGEVFDIEYYWLTDTMSTNALYKEIAEDYAANLGLNKDKILFIDLNDSEYRSFIIDSNIRTASELFEICSGFGWRVVIVTEEDISDKNFDDFEPRCHENEITFGITINIYSSDNITNLDDLKARYKDIRWADPDIVGHKPYVSYVPDAESDIFDRYNLKSAVYIGYPAEHRQVEIIKLTA